MKGIILAAGKGTRLLPLTKTISKPMLPVYNRPMICYAVDILLEAEIKDIMIVVSYENKEMIEKQLGDGREYGVNFSYQVQKEPDGCAGALKVTKDFIEGEDCVLIFGDNVFLSKDIQKYLEVGTKNLKNGYSSIFAYTVKDPRKFGVLELDKNGSVIAIEEKPEHPKTNLIAPGLYFFDSTLNNRVSNLKKSFRGEYEIADVIDSYIKEGNLKAIVINKDNCIWFDAGTHDALLEASVEAKKFYSQN